jgi:molybdate transport system substrate-binding protein
MRAKRRVSDGKVNPLLMSFLAAGLLASVLLWWLPWQGATPDDSDFSATERPLMMLVAAGLRTPVEAILAEYDRETGTKVDVQYGGSNLLLNQLKINKYDQPDLYLAADAFYTAQAVAEGLAAEVIPLARQEPVIAFRRGKAIQASRWAELLQQELRWSLADPEQAAIGRSVRTGLDSLPASSTEYSSLWKQLEAQTTRRGVFKPTVNEVANDIKIGAVDVGIVWNSTVARPEYREDLQAIRFVDLQETRGMTRLGDTVSVAVLTSSRQPTAALRLARYLGARDRGLQVFQAYGMIPEDGDIWSPQPEITFFCGAVNRRAIAPVIEAFQRREGCVINTVYDGCGILTARMGTVPDQNTRAGFPDVYMACDRYYLDTVSNWFQDDINVSQTEIVLVTVKNSEKVRDLGDLIKPGVRVSVGEPEKCTIGALTRRFLEDAGLYEALKAKQQMPGEVVVEKSSSALILPDVLTGHVDAALVYRSDLHGHESDVTIIPLRLAGTQATQPLSIARTSPHKQLIRRLIDSVKRARASFESAGFKFLLTE